MGMTDKAMEIAEATAEGYFLNDEATTDELADIIRPLLPKPVVAAESDKEFIEAMFSDEKNAFPVTCHYGKGQAKEHWTRMIAAYRESWKKQSDEEWAEKLAEKVTSDLLSGKCPNCGGKE